MSSSMRAPVLDGVRMLELDSGPAGRVAGMLMSDQGALVTLLRRVPGGSLEPHAVWDRGKAIREASGSGLESMTGQLLGTTDVLLEGADGFATDGDGERLAALRGRHPHLVTARITAYGPTGPLTDRSTDAASLVAARYGLSSAQPGWDADDPSHLALPVVEVATGLLLAQGIAAALRAEADVQYDHIRRIGISEQRFCLGEVSCHPCDEEVGLALQ